MITAIISIAGFIIVSLVLFVIVRARRGHRIAIHLHAFDTIYDRVFAETGSTKEALREAFPVFKDCRPFNQLTDSEFERFISTIGTLQDPRKIVDTLILKMDSVNAVAAFRNQEFLASIVSLDKKHFSN